MFVALFALRLLDDDNEFCEVNVLCSQYDSAVCAFAFLLPFGTEVVLLQSHFCLSTLNLSLLDEIEPLLLLVWFKQ